MELRQLKYFIKVGEALSRSGLDPSILGAIYIGTLHAYCKFLLGEMVACYRHYEVLDPNRMADIYSKEKRSEIIIAGVATCRCFIFQTEYIDGM